MQAILAAILLALAALPLSAVAAAQVYVSSFYANLGRFDALTGTAGIIIPSAAGLRPGRRPPVAPDRAMQRKVTSGLRPLAPAAEGHCWVSWKDTMANVAAFLNAVGGRATRITAWLRSVVAESA